MKLNLRFILKFNIKKNFVLKKIFILAILISSNFINNFISKDIKVCICTIGKSENLYVREYISHYKKYEVDKIFIYDNNDINGERFETIIDDYIENKYVEIINFRGKITHQLIAYQDCLNKNFDKYNWLIFYDMDEFIHINNFKSIKTYLNQQKFDKCQTIQLNFFFHTDNDLLYYDNRTLSERFIKKIKRPKETLKSILKGNIKINVNCVHNINDKLNSCNGYGQINKREKEDYNTYFPDYKFNYIDHYCFKSTEEFINKLNRGSAYFGKGDEIKLKKIEWYFYFNKLTLEKLDRIEKYTKLNLSKYRENMLKKE